MVSIFILSSSQLPRFIWMETCIRNPILSRVPRGSTSLNSVFCSTLHKAAASLCYLVDISKRSLTELTLQPVAPHRSSSCSQSEADSNQFMWASRRRLLRNCFISGGGKSDSNTLTEVGVVSKRRFNTSDVLQRTDPTCEVAVKKFCKYTYSHQRSTM